MRTKLIFLSLLIALAGFGSLQSSAQQDEDVRGAFLTTRPTTSAKTDKPGSNSQPSRRRPKAITTKATTANNAATASDSTTNASTPRKAGPQRLGMGLTLFMRDSNGLSVRADPTRTFHK